MREGRNGKIERAVAANLRRLREAKGLSQEQAAVRFGVTRNTWHAWENDRPVGAMTRLPELAEFFGVAEDELIRLA